jgi:endonuclease-8
VPEGDTIFRAARTLNRALAAQKITHFETAYAKLARTDDDTPIAGRTVERVEARGKWNLIYLSGDLILLTHMLMIGSWHIYRPGEKWQRPRSAMRVVIHTETILAVLFDAQIAEFHTAKSLAARKGIQTLGPSLLAADFSPDEALARLRSRPDLELGVASMTQSLLAGVGNVFKSEVCFVSGLNPFRKVRDLTAKELETFVGVAQQLLKANVTSMSGDQIVTYHGMRRTTGRSDPSERLWVYNRAGEPCRHCGTPVESYRQGEEARTTFWCPQCQPARKTGAGAA